MNGEHRYTVGRIDGKTAVLQADGGAEVALPLRNLGCPVAKGTVIVVPLAKDSWPEWQRARVEHTDKKD